MKNTAVTFREAKGGEKLVMITAYDYSTARVMDAAGVNAILVGDSLGMVMLGYEDTLSVTLDDMIRHCAAVARGTREALVVCDMPFMSYHTGVEEAVRNAGRLMVEGRAQAVKLEGGADFCPEVRALVRASIPVVGHLGLTPQSVNAFGGYKVQGKTPLAAQNSWTTPAPCRTPGPSPWCSNACRPPGRQDHPGPDHPYHRHWRGARTATARCSSGRT